MIWLPGGEILFPDDMFSRFDTIPNVLQTEKRTELL